MKKKILIIAMIVILVVVLSIIFFLRIPLSEEYITNQIENANYCNAKSDCARAIATCKFGCNIFVNKNEVVRISDLIRANAGGCMLKCGTVEDFDCIDNKCQAIYK